MKLREMLSRPSTTSGHYGELHFARQVCDFMDGTQLVRRCEAGFQTA